MEPELLSTTVEREVILGFEIAVGTEAVGRGVVGVGKVLLNAGLEQREIGIAPAVEGQVFNLLFLHDAADVGGLRLQQGRGFVYLEDLDNLTRLEGEIDRRAGLDVDLDVFYNLAAKPRCVSFYAVGAGPQRAELVLARVVRCGVEDDVGGFLGSGNGGLGDGGATGVADSADDGTGVNLSEHGCRKQQPESDGSEAFHTR